MDTLRDPGVRRRLENAATWAVRRELLGILLWAATVGVVYGTLTVPFWLHLVLVFVWLVISGLTFVALSRANQRDTRAVFQESLGQISAAQADIIMQTAIYSEARDAFTGEHLHRVRRTAIALAITLGESRESAEEIGRAAVAHDLGKIGIPDAVLGKPAKLTDEEFEVIKTHTVIGERVLGDSPLFVLERQSARHHHEWWDGSGYPDGLAGNEIPLVARITAVADVFDALITRRPYKDPWSLDRAIDYIKERRSIQFDPDVVDAFMNLCQSGALPLPPGIQTPDADPAETGRAIPVSAADR